MPDFRTIRPDVTDTFSFDLTQVVGAAQIVAATWTCEVAPESPVSDPDPASHLIGPATYLAGVTSQLVGNMVDGAIYTLTGRVTLDDNRVLAQSGTVECASAPPGPGDLTVDALRQEFTALADSTAYSDESIQFWIDQVVNLGMLNGARWGTWLPLGQKLWVAHQVVVDAQVNRSSARGGLALTTGVPTSRSVGGVSVSYDTSLGVEQDAGYFALTPYGNRYWQLAQMIGAGPITV